MNVKLSDGTVINCSPHPVGEGASGAVFLSVDRKSAVKLFKAPTPDRQGAMQKILGEYNCVASDEYWRSLFCWPDGLVTEPCLGIRMPAIPAGYRPLVRLFLSKCYARLARQEKSWYSRLLMALRLARAVARLHRTGLAHSDLSPNNIYVEPVNGRIIVIDIDGLVVQGFLPPQVIGTPEYIAPELLAGGGMPSWSTDRHALAVLIYQFLLYRHPLRGPKKYSNEPEEDERRALGQDAIFIEHPTDRSNRPTRGFWPSEILGATIKTLFQRAFVEGLRNPAARPTAGDWESAIARMSDRVVGCANATCDEQYFAVSDGVPIVCPWCGTPWALPTGTPVLRLFRQDPNGRFEPEADWWIAGVPGRTIHRWHAETGIDPGPQVDNEPVCRVEMRNGSWRLLNLSLERMCAVSNGKTGAPIQKGESTPLVDGAIVLLAAPPHGRAVMVQALRSA